MIAVDTVADFVEDEPGMLRRVVFCCFDETALALHQEALAGR